MTETSDSGNTTGRAQKEMFDDMMRVAEELGRAPKTTEYNERGEFSTATFYHNFECIWKEFWKKTQYDTVKLYSVSDLLNSKADIEAKYIKIAAETTDHPKTVEELSSLVIDKMYEDDVAGKDQGGVVGGAVYYVAEQLGLRASTHEIADVLGVSNKAVLKNRDDLVDDWKIPQVVEVK